MYFHKEQYRTKYSKIDFLFLTSFPFVTFLSFCFSKTYFWLLATIHRQDIPHVIIMVNVLYLAIHIKHRMRFLP